MCVVLRLAEDYKEQKWAAMSELEKELQQMEAQYDQQFGDVSESEEEEDVEAGEDGLEGPDTENGGELWCQEHIQPHVCVDSG